MHAKVSDVMAPCSSGDPISCRSVDLAAFYTGLLKSTLFLPVVKKKSKEGFHALEKWLSDWLSDKCGILQILQCQLLKPSCCLSISLLLKDVWAEALLGTIVH